MVIRKDISPTTPRLVALRVYWVKRIISCPPASSPASSANHWERKFTNGSITPKALKIVKRKVAAGTIAKSVE
jgi:hypothetical protein